MKKAKKITPRILVIATTLLFLLFCQKGEAFAKTEIMGRSRLTVPQMEQFLHKIHPEAPSLAGIFLNEGRKEGVRGDIAFVQSLKETGYFRFGGDVLPEQNNFAGIGATNVTEKGKGAWFTSAREGIRAQIQHLKAYASTGELKLPLVDPRFHLVKRGSAPCVEDLNGKWAVPGNGYGQDIMKMYQTIVKTVKNEKLQKLQERLREQREGTN